MDAGYVSSLTLTTQHHPTVNARGSFRNGGDAVLVMSVSLGSCKARRRRSIALYFVVRTQVLQFDSLRKYREQESCRIERCSSIIEFDKYPVARSVCGHDM